MIEVMKEKLEFILEQVSYLLIKFFKKNPRKLFKMELMLKIGSNSCVSKDCNSIFTEKDQKGLHA